MVEVTYYENWENWKNVALDEDDDWDRGVSYPGNLCV